MHRKLIISTLGIFALMLQACGQKPQYGKKPLELDGFDFKLDIVHFFQDESIFRWHNKEGLMVSSSEQRLEDDSLMPGFIQYSTRSMSTDRPLARYADVQFEDLGLLTDWDDEQVMMVCGSSNYMSKDDILKIIEALKKEFGSEPELQHGGFFKNTALYLVYRQKDRVVKFGFYLPDVDFIDWPEERSRGSDFWGDERKEAEEKPRKVTLTKETEKKIEEKLKENEENNCFLFISQTVMNEVMKSLNSRSGFLVNYKRDVD